MQRAHGSRFIARRLSWIGAVLATVLVAACGGAGGGAGSGGSSSPAQLTYWSRGANDRINGILVDTWNATHSTKIKLLPVPDDQYATKFAAAVNAGTPPDVVTLDVVSIPGLLDSNVLAGITSKARALPYFDKLAPSYIKTATRNGTIYALPENTDASTLFYNKDLFRKAGLDPEKPPTTFAELEQDAARITALGGGVHGFYFSGQCGGCNAYTFDPLVWASGGDFVSGDGKRSTLTNPAVKSALELYRTLWTSGDVPDAAKTDTGANWVQAFGSGKIGMESLGAFAIGQMKKNFPTVDYGITTIPGRQGGRSAFTGGDVVAIPRGSKHFDAAWDFLQWSLSRAAQVEVYAKDGSLVARSDLVDNKYSHNDPHVLAENRAVAAGRQPVYYRNSLQIDAPTGPFNQAFQSVIFGGANPDPTLASAQSEFQRLLNIG